MGRKLVTGNKRGIPGMEFLLIRVIMAIYMGIEVFTTIIGMEKEYNGWNLRWSLLFNCVMFPLLILHHKNPVLAWIIASVFLAVIMKIFNVPFIANGSAIIRV